MKTRDSFVIEKIVWPFWEQSSLRYSALKSTFDSVGFVLHDKNWFYRWLILKQNIITSKWVQQE